MKFAFIALLFFGLRLQCINNNLTTAVLGQHNYALKWDTLRCAPVSPLVWRYVPRMKSMLKYLSILFILLSVQTFAGKFASEANDNPFANGELNAKYEGEATALGGTVLKRILVNNNNLYLLDLKTPPIKHIWVTSFIKPQGKEVVEVGDNVIFKGYISIASSLDDSGKLISAIKSETLLMAIHALNKGT